MSWCAMTAIINLYQPSLQPINMLSAIENDHDTIMSYHVTMYSEKLNLFSTIFVGLS